jgi:hypothetical protein
MELINVGIIRHPMNWLTVILMVLIAGIVCHLVMRHWGNN